jgi:hypothetical protein
MMFHRFRVIAVALLLAMLPAAPAVAMLFQPDPSEVARAVRDRGVYVDPGSDLSEERAAELVAAVRNDGERLSIVVLDEDPVTGAVAFGDTVVDRLTNPGLLLVVSPGDFGVVGEGDVYTVAELDDALTAAENAGGTDSSLVQAFVVSLVGVGADVDLPAATAAPEPAGEPAAATSGGGFPWLLVFFLLGGGLLVFWMVRRSRKRTTIADDTRLAQARGEIQKQLDAVANDILEMEDEVRVADRPNVDELYQAAGQTYQTASEQLASADTPAEFLEITNELDVAVWQLDSVEALLDGKSPPPKPIPKQLEPPPRPTTSPGPEGGGSLGLPPKPSYPSDGSGYERRPSRRSGGLSPSIIEMLVALGAGALGSRRSSGGGLGGLFPRRSSALPPPPPSRPASSSPDDGGFLPSPSQRGTTAPPPSKPSTRRGTGGRIRMGRRRRR